MKNLTKMQIETAQQILDDTLKNKIKEIAEKSYKKDMSKWTKDIAEIQKDRKNLLEKMKKLDKKIGTKTKKLEINTGYNSLLNALEDDTDIITKKYGAYTINTDNINKEIRNFILNLKLGTTMLSKIEKMIEKINKLK